MSNELERLRRRVDELEAAEAATRRDTEALRESEARLRVLFERAPDAYYLSDLKGVLLDGNQAAEKLCGYSREELVGKSFLKLDLLPAREIARAVKLLAQNALGHPTGPDEFTLRRKHGPRVTVEIHTIPVTLGGRRTVLGIARDITKRREAELAVRRGEERYVRASRAGKVGVWEWELDTNEMYVDPNLKMLLGFRDDEIQNHLDDWGARVHPDDVEDVMKAADAHLSGLTDHYEIEHRMVHKDGSIRWFLARGTLIRGDDGAPIRMVGSDVDITEQKLGDAERRRLESEALSERSQKLESLGMLAGGVAHDFNNLLTTILGHAGMALNKMSPDEPARARVEQIESAAIAAAELTSQLLTYSGKGQSRIGPTNLNRAIRETTSLIGVSIPKKVAVLYDLSDSLPSVQADDSQLRQVVMNLVINASEAMENERGTIAIATGTDASEALERLVERPSAKGPFAYLEVRDTGRGMTELVRRRIFDPFYTTKFTGRGLGLAAVRGIVRAHGGGIRIDTKPGQGTTVRVLFALAADDARERDENEPRRAAHPKMRGAVLLVDDETAVREVVSSMLEDVGLKVLAAPDGASAIRALERHDGEIHAAVLDWIMPDLNGEETLERLRGLKPDLPVVFMSGFNDRSARFSYAEAANVAFVQKPFRQHEILEKLKAVWPTRLPAARADTYE